jgi:hypothetical protein
MNDLDVLRARKRYLNGHLKLPWEQHFAGEVLGQQGPKKSSLLDVPSWVGFGDYMQRSGSDSQPDYVQQTSTHPGAMRRIAIAGTLKTDDEMLFKSLAMVKFLLLMDLTATSLGDVLAGLVMQVGGEETVTQVLRDTFSKRAASTVYKRVSCFWRYSKWDQKSGRCNPWHFTEQKVYEYLDFLRSSGAAATSGQCFLAALAFMHEHVRIKHFDKDFLSPRVGVEHELLLKKRPLLQARALYLNEVEALENFVIDPTEPHLGIIAGYLMWCLATSSRFSDSMEACGFEIDEAQYATVVAAGTYRHKTSVTAMQKTTLLPLLGLGKWFAEVPWAACWLEMMEEAFGQVEGRAFLLPAFSEKSLQWLPRKMSSAEGTLWLRDILKLAGQGRCVESLTTHCLKVTRLAWFTISGKFSLEERRIAGHHLDKEHRSALTYGRDNHLAVLKKEAVLLQKVKMGRFDPDESRARHIDREIDALLQEHVDAQEGEDSDFDHFDEVQDGVDIAEDADNLDHAVVDNPLDPTLTYYQHHLSGTLHIEQAPLKFECGRATNSNYSAVSGNDLLRWQLCSQCRVAKYGL